MSASVDSRRRDEQFWSIATRSGPIVIQCVLGVLVIAQWLLGKSSFIHHDDRAGERASLLIATAVAFGISLLVAGVFCSQRSSRARGIGLSVVASACIVLIGGAWVAFLLF